MNPRLDGMKRTYSDTYWNYIFLFLFAINPCELQARRHHT